MSTVSTIISNLGLLTEDETVDVLREVLAHIPNDRLWKELDEALSGWLGEKEDDE